MYTKPALKSPEQDCPITKKREKKKERKPNYKLDGILYKYACKIRYVIVRLYNSFQSICM